MISRHFFEIRFASIAKLYILQLSGSARSPYAAGGREDEISLWRIQTMQRSTTFGNVAEGGTFDFIGISTNHGFPNLGGSHKFEKFRNLDLTVAAFRVTVALPFGGAL